MLLGFETLDLKFCDLKLWKPTVLLLLLHSCHILPFQAILWNKYFPPELAKTAKHSPKSISEGGRIWQVCINRIAYLYRVQAPRAGAPQGHGCSIIIINVIIIIVIIIISSSIISSSSCSSSMMTERDKWGQR